MIEAKIDCKIVTLPHELLVTNSFETLLPIVNLHCL